MTLNLKTLFSLFLFFLNTTICAQGVKEDLVKHKSLFSDNLYSTVRSKVNKKKITKVKNELIRHAITQMVDGTYDYDYRVQEYKHYLHPEMLAKELKTSPYSQFENPTGIYFIKDSPVVLVVGPCAHDVSLRITNFGKEGGDSSYQLIEGINTIIPTHSGNGYISFFAKNKEKLGGDVKIHIMGGEVNGIFDRSKQTNKEWKRLLNSSCSSEILDVLGERVQLAYSKESLRKFCPEDGVALISVYDSIVTIQHDIMGLNKYNRVPKNHIFGRVIWSGFMHADHLGAAFHDNVMSSIADPIEVRKSLWGVAHEFGHVNQVRPWMTWVGTTEVTNNIYSVWSQYLFNPEQPKLEREVLKDYDGNTAGGRITSYMESAFIHKQPWLTQAGPDRWDRERPRDWGGDHFVKLVPLWQLQLYYTVVGEGNKWYNPDFYADIYIQAIDEEKKLLNHSDAQLAFIRAACDAAQSDLTDFFEYSGMLLPIDLWVDDYTCAQMTITKEDIAKVKSYASKYNKPATPVMHYLTANSVESFKHQLPVSGMLNKGVTVDGHKLTINHEEWKNVVAFETYKGDDLVKIAFVGAGSIDNKSTLVRFPEGATRVEAIAWDGTKQMVYKI